MAPCSPGLGFISPCWSLPLHLQPTSSSRVFSETTILSVLQVDWAPSCLCVSVSFRGSFCFWSGGSWCHSLCLASAFSFRSWLKSHWPSEPLENSFTISSIMLYHSPLGHFLQHICQYPPRLYICCLSHRLWFPQKHKSQSVYFCPSPCEPSHRNAPETFGKYLLSQWTADNVLVTELK